MENKKFCQSCAMPLTKTEDFGTNADGSKNEDYCQYCFENGAFKADCTMDDARKFMAASSNPNALAEKYYSFLDQGSIKMHLFTVEKDY